MVVVERGQGSLCDGGVSPVFQPKLFIDFFFSFFFRCRGGSGEYSEALGRALLLGHSITWVLKGQESFITILSLSFFIFP